MPFCGLGVLPPKKDFLGTPMAAEVVLKEETSMPRSLLEQIVSPPCFCRFFLIVILFGVEQLVSPPDHGLPRLHLVSSDGHV